MSFSHILFAFDYVSSQDENYDEEFAKLTIPSMQLTLFKSKSFYKDKQSYGFKGKSLGSGAFGEVFSFDSITDDEIVIKKIFDDKKSDPQKNEKINIDDFAHEAEINYIVYKVGDLGIAKNGGIFLRMKKLPPSLQQIYFDQSACGFSTFREFLALYIKILYATKELHEKFKIVHLDLNYSNVCMDSKGIIYFCDFSTSRKLQISDTNSKPEMTAGMTHKNCYSPPELNHKIEANVNQDIYYLGKMLYYRRSEMKKLPDFHLYEKLYHELYLQMTNEDPSKRVSLNETLKKMMTVYKSHQPTSTSCLVM